MDNRRRSIILLEQADWGEDAPMIQGLKEWAFYPVLTEAIRTLKVEALYKSAVHGSGHINRVLLMAGIIGWQERLEESLLRQFLLTASYHDVGRTFDGLDLEHGTASAARLEELTGCRGQKLLEMQGAVAAHSHPDGKMRRMILQYQPKDVARTMELASLLKDADNLDRVRLGDINVNYLRHDSAKRLEGFTWRLFQLDQEWKRKFCAEIV